MRKIDENRAKVLKETFFKHEDYVYVNFMDILAEHCGENDK
jgi:hypothetical protein